MPTNRRPVPKEQKREELLAAAAELFVRDGYDATSMSKLATHAGVTANTLYWYFRDKDELLVAVADRYLQGLLRHHATVADRPLAEQLRWLVERLRPVNHLVATVHNRVAAAESVAAWHTGFHRSIEALFERQLPGPFPAERRAAEAAAATFALEGALVHDLDDTTTGQLCEIVAERLHHAVDPDRRTPTDDGSARSPR
ncbi:TetR/AcrR family transcriptional regulator [Amycolatopsis sp. NPDC049159]|uniref:TetR/AcrR family transcriptional regulator n=1 Tax=Amycolatopsis sp. NPDC049159 TaxID=3157210 RepID=UPI0033CE5041